MAQMIDLLMLATELKAEVHKTKARVSNERSKEDQIGVFVDKLVESQRWNGEFALIVDTFASTSHLVRLNCARARRIKLM
jgi:hypothetical protein